MKTITIKIDKATSKTLMASALLSMAFDEAIVKNSTCGDFEHEAYITEKNFEFDESIQSGRKPMSRMFANLSLSSIGLVWKHFGLQILDNLECFPEYQEIVWRRIDGDFISTLDSYKSDVFELADFLSPSNPSEEDFMTYMQEQILKHIDFLSSGIYEGILDFGTEYYINKLLKQKGEKNYIEIYNGNIPWRKNIEVYNRFNLEGHPVQFVVYPCRDLFVAESVEKPIICSGEEHALIYSLKDKDKLLNEFQTNLKYF